MNPALQAKIKYFGLQNRNCIIWDLLIYNKISKTQFNLFWRLAGLSRMTISKPLKVMKHLRNIGVSIIVWLTALVSGPGGDSTTHSAAMWPSGPRATVIGTPLYLLHVRIAWLVTSKLVVYLTLFRLHKKEAFKEVPLCLLNCSKWKDTGARLHCTASSCHAWPK